MRTESRKLENGLRIICHHSPSTAMAAVNVLYDVGARDESPELTGIAHLFEHLMFSGSENVEDFDGEMYLAGAETNAWTTSDFTNFYCTVPAGNLETVFRCESDRMLSLAFSQRSLDVQKGVVIEEFHQSTLDAPYGDLMSVVRSAAYRVHPYRWDVIGVDPGHIERATLDDIRQFFFTHYGPDNAILSVAGPTDPETVFRLAEKWFGDIPPRNRPARNLPQEPEQQSPVETTVYRNVPAAHITVAWHTEGFLSPQVAAADLLTDILAQGHSSRAYRRMLLGKDLFARFDTSITASEDPGLLLLNARLRENSAAAIDAALREIDSFIEEVVNDGVTPHELQRAKNQFESNQIYDNVSNRAKAQNMAMNHFHCQTYEPRAQNVNNMTVDFINGAARRIFRPDNRSTVLYLPK